MLCWTLNEPLGNYSRADGYFRVPGCQVLPGAAGLLPGCQVGGRTSLQVVWPVRLPGCRVIPSYCRVAAGLLPRGLLPGRAAGLPGDQGPTSSPFCTRFRLFAKVAHFIQENQHHPLYLLFPSPPPSILPLKVLYIWAFIKSGYMIIYVAKNAAPTSKK